MAVNCGVCSVSCDNSMEYLKCSGNCEKTYHLACLPADAAITRGAKREWVCEQCKKDKGRPASSTGSKCSTTGTTLTKEFLMNVMEAFKNEVFAEIQLLRKENEGLKESLMFSSEVMDTTNKLLEQINKSYAEVKKESDLLRENNNKLTQAVKELQIKVRNMEQYSRKTNIEISGVPKTAGEDVISIVKDVGSAIGIELKKEEVMAAHRVPAFKTDRTPALIVQFSTRTTRDTWLKSFREKKGLNAKEVNAAFSNRIKVFVNEHLTPENKQLLARTKAHCKEIGYSYVWCREGKVFVRKGEGQQCVRIDDLGDLAKLA